MFANASDLHMSVRDLQVMEINKEILRDADPTSILTIKPSCIAPEPLYFNLSEMLDAYYAEVLSSRTVHINPFDA